MDLTSQVRNYVLPNGIDLSNIRSKESLVNTQNELAEVLKQLIEARNMITMGNSSAFMGMNYLDSSNNIITDLQNNFDPNNPEEAIDSLKGILSDSQVLRDRNLNIASVMSSLSDFNFDESIGDLLSGKTELLDSLKDGVSGGISNLADLSTQDLTDTLANIDLESIPKTVNSSLTSFGSSVGSLDPSFNDITFSKTPTEITQRIGLSGKKLSEMFQIKTNRSILGTDVSGDIDITDVGNTIKDTTNEIKNQVSGPAKDFIDNATGNAENLSKQSKSLFTDITNGDFSLTNIKSMSDSVKGIVGGVCEFILGAACCVENYINSIKDNNFGGDIQWSDLLNALGPLAKILKAIMALLGFLLFLIMMLISAIKKIIDEIINIINLLVIECKDSYTDCLCKSKV